ncbi:MAG: putative sugar O-methyltransferase [Mesorhizobium sp.]|nr:MAG: putative sugar O-methyltransferase [Mesorhizobium sp.]
MLRAQYVQFAGTSGGMSARVRKITKDILALSQNCLGFTAISTRTRDRLLADAPNLSRYFLLVERPKHPIGKLPDGCHTVLRADHPDLQDLRRRYANHPATEHIQWSRQDVETRLDLSYFRADNPYVFQSRAYSPLVFYATAAYVEKTDKADLFQVLEEDNYFGAETFDFHGKLVSRDLLDSIIELNFLAAYVPLYSESRSINVLDIGAGYGRLAHRMTAACPNVGKYFCTDAVPESTFLSQYYLAFRNVLDRCAVVPLDKVTELRSIPIELAINVHSFTECRGRVVAWWLEELSAIKIPWLFIETDFGLTSRDGYGVRDDFREKIEESGYRLIVQQPKFAQSQILRDHGLYPSEFYLFRRT